MARRWSVAGQLLALQLGIIAVVLVGVGGVSLAQAQIDFRRTEGARVALGGREPRRPHAAAPGAVGAVPAGAGGPVGADRRRRAEPVRRDVRRDRRRRRRRRREHPRPRAARHLALPADTGHPAARGWPTAPAPAGRRSSRTSRCSARSARRPGAWWARPRSARSTRAWARACCPQCRTCSPTWGWPASSGSPDRCSSPAGSSARPSAWSRWRSAAWSSTARRCSPGSRRASSASTSTTASRWSTPRPTGCWTCPPTASDGRSPSSASRTGCSTSSPAAPRSRTPSCSWASGSSRSTASRSPSAASGRLGHDHARPAPSCGQLEQELGVTRQTTEALRAQAHEFANRLHTIAGLLELERVRRGAALRQAARLGDPGARGGGHRARSTARRSPRCSSPSPAWPPSAASGCTCADASRVGPLDDEPGRGPRDRRRQPRRQRAGRRRPARRRRGRRCRVRAGGRRRDGRGPRLGPRGGARAGRGGLHQRVHAPRPPRAATAGSAWP